MNRSVIMLCLLAGVTGCMEMQVKQNAVALTTTTSDLFYLEVLDNIALIIDNSDALPYFDAPAAATAQIQRSLQGSYNPGWDFITASMSVFAGRWLLDKHQATLTGQQLSQEAWQMATLSDPDRLYLMQAAYKRITDHATPESERVLAEYYAARNGWVNVEISELSYTAKRWALLGSIAEIMTTYSHPRPDDVKIRPDVLERLSQLILEYVALTNPLMTRHTQELLDKYKSTRLKLDQLTQNNAPKEELDKWRKEIKKIETEIAPLLSGRTSSSREGEGASGGPALSGGGGASPTKGPLPIHVPYESFIRGGWFCIGKKKQVPKNACYVGHHCNSYVWVTREDLPGLAQFTMAIADFYNIVNSGPNVPNTPPVTLNAR